MLDVLSFQPLGAIFDVDDTLLDNYPDKHELGLHERARLQAIHEVGARKNIPELANVDAELNRHVIKRAREHSIEGGTWQLFYELGLVGTPEIDHSNLLLQEIAARKHELYEPILREFGVPLPQAVEFVQAMSVLTEGRIAIASGAQKKDVLVFLDMTGLRDYFQENRIICRQDFVQAKPNPEAFDTAFTSLSLSDEDRRRVLAFEDDPKGIASAKQAGLYVCGITSRFAPDGLSTAGYHPDMIRDSYVDFAAVLGITL